MLSSAAAAATAAVVSSSTCSPPAAAAAPMRPPPPPPPPKHQHSAAAKGPEPRTNHEEPSSSIPDLEFDGTTVLCRVCGDKASGFHYGVHSCEGCKGFFRRSIQQKIQYRPCTKNQQCSILRINRNRCQYCRLKKCIAVGMSRDAVRFGRVPKREKARILAAMQQSCSSRSHEKALAHELEDEAALLSRVVRAHVDTCDFTREKVAPMLQGARQQPVYTSCPATLACPLNPNPQPLTGQQELLQDFSKRFSPAIRGVVEFAKRIPGFALLPQDDQVTLLKAGVFEVLLVRLACLFDAQTNSMICLNGQVLKRESIHSSSNARFLMDSMFDFAERLNSLQLSDAEVGLFCSVVVIAPDRPGLRNADLVERMQSKLRDALQSVLAQNHGGAGADVCHELMKKIPDLRTLNTLHSEKLLAFKMTEQQQQLQQQQQQHMWGVLAHEEESKSPPSWSDAALDEAVKSPLGSVSSSESVCGGEVAELCPHRARVAPDATPHHRFTARKLDSPSDSGIESGTEKTDNAPTSVCSSPRSSLEDKDASIVEDMPVLKRVLQAPPLYDTNSLMDEAYKPHKKFRALRTRDTAEAEPLLPHAAPQLHLHLTAQPQPPPPAAGSLSSTHSTLARSLMEGPRMTPEQRQRTDIIHSYIMRGGGGGDALTEPAPYHHHHYGPPAPPQHQQQPPAPRWQGNTPGVITSAAAYSPPAPAPAAPYLAQSPPPSASSSTSPPPPATPPQPKMVALQVDIADSQQPLNLSKKSPTPPPKVVVSLEA